MDSSEFQHHDLTHLMHCNNMAQQGKQLRVDAREGCPCDSVKLVLLANVNRYEVDFNTFLLSGEILYPCEISPCPNFNLSLHISISIICAFNSFLERFCTAEKRNGVKNRHKIGGHVKLAILVPIVQDQGSFFTTYYQLYGLVSVSRLQISRMAYNRSK